MAVGFELTQGYRSGTKIPAPFYFCILIAEPEEKTRGLREEQQQKNNAHGSPIRPSGSSAFSRCLREKGLNLPPHFSAVAAGALNRFFCRAR